ncbi:MAG TPA: zf-HC2 domain-containing protein [Gemmatimonadota bacterium]|nr:zf-HC2 domain-containing protein [Gemmatimonadota bacterium]
MDRRSCTQIRQRLDSYVDGELVEAEARAVEEHLAACGLCAERLAFERALLDGLKQRIREAYVPPGLRSRIRDALERGRAERSEATESRFEG